jgi:hypothetical protein
MVPVRRVVLTTIAVATAAATASAVAAPTAGVRHVTRTYTAATTATTGNGQAQGSGLVLVGGPVQGSYGLTFIKLRQADRSASIRLTDRTGRTVQALVQQTSRDGSVATLGIICGSTRHPLRLAPGGGGLTIRPSYGTCGQNASTPTTGTLDVTLR